MSSRTYYTALGHFRRRINGLGRSCPVIIISEQEYDMDIQEMALWTTLNWRLLDFPQAEAEYNKLNQDCAIPALRTLENCLGTRGLVASGTAGRTLRRCTICWAGCMCPRCPRTCSGGWRRFLHFIPLFQTVSLRAYISIRKMIY
ncbi:MAG: hypothetical protein HFG03_11745 [Oscillibacter sp.]|jgi:hypothetical protein|nr:hypothetical protein [Oscillibacter sp.]